MNVRKTVILTAGLGIRFLPVSKSIPKAMLPIWNKPVVQYLVEEAAASGIEEVIIVLGPNQEAIKEYFSPKPELEQELSNRDKTDLLKTAKEPESLARFTFVTQQESLGDGHAILQAKEVIGNEPFAVLFGDDLIKGEEPALAQLLTVFAEKNLPILCAERIPREETKNYGIIGAKEPNATKKIHEIETLIEKPSPAEAPSDLAIIGKYICTPEVLTHLEKIHADTRADTTDGELRLIDGFRSMLKAGLRLFALEVNGKRFDTGRPEGLLAANQAYKPQEQAK